jgi:antitoxin component of MazEF toxin-antitoxin module
MEDEYESKWGNSAALQIPASVTQAMRLDLDPGLQEWRIVSETLRMLLKTQAILLIDRR